MRYLSLTLLAALLSSCTAATSSETPSPSAVPSPAVSSAALQGEAPPIITEHMRGDAMLIFSETRGWRHNEGIAGAGKTLVELAEEMGYAMYSTEYSAVFTPENLARFKLVVMNNMSGEALTPNEQAALEDWFDRGGAIVSIHAAGDSSHEKWPWYAEKVIGPRFTAHPAGPQFQTARVETLRPGHPVMAGIPDSWEHNEEWYSFDSTAQSHGMTPLAGLDESTYSPRNEEYGDYVDLRMDLNGQGPIAHPIIWSKCHGGNEGPRSVYTALGHQVSVYDKETSSGIPRLILKNALNWAVKNTDPSGEGCAP